MGQKEPPPSDHLRERVIELLKANYAQNTIDIEEFEKRLITANETQSRIILEDLVADLSAVDTSPKRTVSSKSNSTGSYSINRETVKHGETYFGILGSTEKRGSWKPPRNITSITFMGSVELDFSNAQLPPDEISIHVVCIMGGLDIFIPEGVEVVSNVVPIMGGIDDKTDAPHDPSAPVIRISGLLFMGGIDIKHKKYRRE